MKEEKFINDSSSGRVLGSEWKDWEGAAENKDAEAPKSLFLGVSVASLAAILLAVFVFWYLISPRIFILSAFVHRALQLMLSIGGAVFFLWSALVLCEAAFGKSVSFLAFTHKDFLGIYYPAGNIFRRMFKIGRDRFSSSFVKVSNLLIGRPRAGRAAKTVVLLPRCLQKEIREKIQSVSGQKKIPVFVVGGGEQARSVLLKEKPDSVIAVACERDLVAGIADISKKIAVIGIANKRPNGPCKDTSIDLGQFEEALKAFVP